MKRWTAIAHYYADGQGTIMSRRYDIDEMYELHDIIERGPNFAAVARVVVHYNHERTTLEAD